MNEIEKFIKSFFENINIDYKDIIGKIDKELGEKGSELNEETIKMFWNYSEKNTKEYSFKELLEWAKSNIPQGIKKVCVYKMQNENNRIQLHMVYLDSEDKPLLTGDYPHQLINTLSLDSELNEKFGDKNMIVLG